MNLNEPNNLERKYTNPENLNQTLTRVPPHDQEAELAVISSMLLDYDALVTGIELLHKEDFYRPDYGEIFDAMTALRDSGKPVDVITLKNKLEERSLYEQIGGNLALNAIAGSVSTSVNIKHYIKIIKDKSLLRKLIKVSNNISGLSFDPQNPVDAVLAHAEESLFEVIQSQNTTESSHISEALIKTIENLEDIYRSGKKITGVPTGLTDFDNKTAGLHPSDLILLAARPSMGKTAIGLNIAYNAAVKHNVPTIIFSLEMSKEQLVNRLICSGAMVDANKMRTGSLDPQDWEHIAEAIGPLSEAPIHLDDTPSISISEVRAKCRQMKMKHGLGLIVIDYLQLMSGSGGRTESRQQEISEISRSLKALAREMNAPVVALAQLSRACEQRADHRPILSDLRESGAIEQDADLVGFLYRDEYYNPDTEKKGVAELIIAKQRNGETGTVELRYMGNYVKFVDLLQEDNSSY